MKKLGIFQLDLYTPSDQGGPQKSGKHVSEPAWRSAGHQNGQNGLLLQRGNYSILGVTGYHSGETRKEPEGSHPFADKKACLIGLLLGASAAGHHPQGVLLRVRRGERSVWRLVGCVWKQDLRVPPRARKGSVARLSQQE